MASLGGEQQISANSQTDEPVARTESREGSIERKVSKDRDEKLKIARERQNEERQRKIEELKAQAEAAQRYREQKEEERKRRIDEIRHRDTEKRQQVEERKKAIMEAEKERREYILRKNQERESRLETKKRDKNSIGFAFGSSTPRLLEPADFGMVSPSTFWGQRRSTSISNVAGASLTRRSSERELADSGSKKRATSATGTERHDDYRRKISSMYEVFNWGFSNDEPPKRFSLSIVGSEINIDEPPPSTNSRSHMSSEHRQNSNHLTATTKNFSTNDDTVDTSHIIFRSVARRKTDLMPTIPSPREGHYGSRSSLSQTPRTPGRAFSMNRLDQLAQPIRRNGEHIRAILERERREQMDMLDETESLGGGGGRRNARKNNNAAARDKDIMTRSMSHLAVSNGGRKYNLGGGISSCFRPLSSGNKDSCKSMTQLTHTWSSTTPRSNIGLQTTATKKYLQSSFASSSTKRGQQHFTTNTYRYDPNSLLLMSSSFVSTGSRSGNVTPGGSISTSRPGSAMSTSTNMSTSGYVNRRSVPVRKPRPASIAGTGVSLEEMAKLKKENKPPVKSSSATSAQTTPKRTSNSMSTSMIVTSSSSRLSSAEKKTPSKKDPNVSKPTTPKPLSKTASSDRLNKISNKDQKLKDPHPSMTKSSIVTTTPTAVVNVEKINTNTTSSDQSSVEAAKLDLVTNDPATPAKTKDEKNALNAVKTEDVIEEILLENKENAAEHYTSATSAVTDEKIDQGNEKDLNTSTTLVVSKAEHNSVTSKENSEIREQAPSSLAVEGGDLMTASMIAKSKITTEEEAKAALAERRRLAREEAERQADLERQRIEAERLAELKRQEEEAERQRQFEEEATRLAAEQRKAEEERLRQAIEEAKQREEEERRKREDEEKQRVEREEAEKKAKEEAEKQRLEVAERLKREEKEREERRKRVEAIMSRTRKAGSSGTPNSTPVKENNENKTSNEQNQQNAQSTPTTTIAATQNNSSSNDESNSTSGSTTSATTPTTQSNNIAEPQNSQAMYEQSVIDKEALLMKGLSSNVIDENAKNLQQHTSQQQQQQPQTVEFSNGKLHTDFPNNDIILQNTTISTVANGNGHIENVNNKNELNILQDVVAPATNQLIDLSLESQGDVNNSVNFNNNNRLLSTTNTLVTADSHENRDISLL